MKDAFIISDMESAVEYVKTTDGTVYKEMLAAIEKIPEGRKLAVEFRKEIVIRESVHRCFEKSGRKAILTEKDENNEYRPLDKCLSAEKHIVTDGRFDLIDAKCFCLCRNAETITFSEGVRFIEECAAKDLKHLRSVTLPKSLKYVGGECFSGCMNLEKVSFGNAETYIGTDAFRDTAWIENIKGDFVVVNSQLIKYRGSEKCVRIPENVRIISGQIFKEDENIEEVIIPKGVKEIGVAAFANCENIRSVIFEGDNPESIRIFAFENCDKINEVILPRSIRKLGTKAFSHRTTVVYNGTDKEMEKHIIENFRRYRIIHIV